MSELLAFFEQTVGAIGLAGFAALWAAKAVLGLVGLRWLRDWTAKRKGLG